MSQLAALKSYFQTNQSLTQYDAIPALGIMRLSERIRELEREGYSFMHDKVEAPTRYRRAYVAKYVLLSRPQEGA